MVLRLQALCNSNLAGARKEARRAAKLKNMELASALDASEGGLKRQLCDAERALTCIHGDMQALHARREAALREELERLERIRERDEQQWGKMVLEMRRLADRLGSSRGASGEISEDFTPEQAGRLPKMYNDRKRELDLLERR